MSSLANILGLVAFLLSGLYCLMGLIASYNQKEGLSRFEELDTLSTLWCFHPEIYNDDGQWLCRKAKWVLYLATIFALLFGVMKYLVL